MINRRKRFQLLAAVGLLGGAACASEATKSSAPDLDTAPVTAPVAAPVTAPVTTPGAAGYDFTALSPVVQRFVDDHNMNGAGLVVVQRDDGVVYEDYWGDFNHDRMSLIASSTKMITAGVLLRLQDDGLLDIDTPVADVVAWGAGNPDITPAQLLSNSSGLVGLLPNPAYGPYLCQYLSAGSLQDCAASIFTTPADDADIVPPDTEFRYGGAQWQVAGAVAEVASGKSWAELVNEIYVEPCGLETLAYNNHFSQIGATGSDYPVAFDADPTTLQPTDNPNMEGGAYLAPGDYAKLLLMHLRGGMCDNNRVLSQAAVDRLHDDRIDDAYDGSAGSSTGYAMGWWVDRSTGRLTDSGLYGTVPWLDLEDGYGAYLVVEANGATGQQLAEQLYPLVESSITATP